MSNGERTWELLTDVDFIGSTTPGTALAGFLEFADDVWLVCSHQEASSDSALSPPSHMDRPDYEPLDLDEIPF